MSENHSLSSPVETPRSQLWRAGKPAQLKPLIITQVGCWLVYDKWHLHHVPGGLFVYFHHADFCHCQCTLSQEKSSIFYWGSRLALTYILIHTKNLVLQIFQQLASGSHPWLCIWVTCKVFVSVVSTVVSTLLFQYWWLDLIPGNVSSKKKRKCESMFLGEDQYFITFFNIPELKPGWWSIRLLLCSW